MRCIKTIGLLMIVGCLGFAFSAEVQGAKKQQGLKVPKDVVFRLELLSPINSAVSKRGDRFNCKVLEPREYYGSIVRGHVTRVKPPGKVNGVSEMAFVFDSITLIQPHITTTGRFNAQLTEVYDVKGARNRGQADEEGKVKSVSKHGTATIVAATIGGGVIGYLLGGYKGAEQGLAIGLAVGAARTILARGRNLDFRTGTQFAVRTTKEVSGKSQSIDEAIKKFPDDKHLKFQKAVLLAQQGQTSRAVALLEPLVEQDPMDLEGYRILSEIYIQGKEFGRAEGTLQKALEAAPSNESLTVRLAAVYQMTRSYDQAETLLAQVIEKNPNHSEALNNLGYMLADRAVQLDRAVEYLKKAVELDPNNGAYLDSLGWAYFQRDELGLAEEFLQRAVSQVTNDPVIHDHLGDLYFKMGQRDKAAEAWQRAIATSKGAEEMERIKAKIQRLKS